MADTWISDANGNKCSVEWFGSRAAAQAALDSLKDCKDCVNCSDCSYCSGCWYCSRCKDKKGYQTGFSGRPLVPVIENIHQAVYAAASNPDRRDESINEAERHRCLILIADIDGLLKTPEDQRLLERFARNVADFERFKSSNCQ